MKQLEDVLVYLEALVLALLGIRKVGQVVVVEELQGQRGNLVLAQMVAFLDSKVSLVDIHMLGYFQNAFKYQRVITWTVRSRLQLRHTPRK